MKDSWNDDKMRTFDEDVINNLLTPEDNPKQRRSSGLGLNGNTFQTSASEHNQAFATGVLNPRSSFGGIRRQTGKSVDSYEKTREQMSRTNPNKPDSLHNIESTGTKKAATKISPGTSLGNSKPVNISSTYEIEANITRRPDQEIERYSPFPFIKTFNPTMRTSSSSFISGEIAHSKNSKWVAENTKNTEYRKKGSTTDDIFESINNIEIRKTSNDTLQSNNIKKKETNRMQSETRETSRSYTKVPLDLHRSSSNSNQTDDFDPDYNTRENRRVPNIPDVDDLPERSQAKSYSRNELRIPERKSNQPSRSQPKNIPANNFSSTDNSNNNNSNCNNTNSSNNKRSSEASNNDRNINNRPNRTMTRSRTSSVKPSEGSSMMPILLDGDSEDDEGDDTFDDEDLPLDTDFNKTHTSNTVSSHLASSYSSSSGLSFRITPNKQEVLSIVSPQIDQRDLERRLQPPRFGYTSKEILVSAVYLGKKAFVPSDSSLSNLLPGKRPSVRIEMVTKRVHISLRRSGDWSIVESLTEKTQLEEAIPFPLIHSIFWGPIRDPKSSAKTSAHAGFSHFIAMHLNESAPEGFPTVAGLREDWGNKLALEFNNVEVGSELQPHLSENTAENPAKYIVMLLSSQACQDFAEQVDLNPGLQAKVYDHNYLFHDKETSQALQLPDAKTREQRVGELLMAVTTRSDEIGKMVSHVLGKVASPAKRRSNRRRNFLESNDIVFEAGDDVVLFKYPMNRDAQDAITIYRGDQRRLFPGIYLNDNLIDFRLRQIIASQTSCTTSPTVAQPSKATTEGTGQGHSSPSMSDVASKKDPTIPLASTITRRTTAAMKIHLFSCLFYAKLTEDSRSKKVGNHKLVERWTKSVNIFDCDYIIVPVNDVCHWSVSIIVNPGAVKDPKPKSSEETPQKSTSKRKRSSEGSMTPPSDLPPDPKEESNQAEDSESYFLSPCIFFMDSMSMHRGVVFGDVLRKYLEEEWRVKFGSQRVFNRDNLPLHDLNGLIPHQVNAYDCGMYVIKYAQMVATYFNRENILRYKKEFESRSESFERGGLSQDSQGGGKNRRGSKGGANNENHRALDDYIIEKLCTDHSFSQDDVDLEREAMLHTLSDLHHEWLELKRVEKEQRAERRRRREEQEHNDASVGRSSLDQNPDVAAGAKVIDSDDEDDRDSDGESEAGDEGATLAPISPTALPVTTTPVVPDDREGDIDEMKYESEVLGAITARESEFSEHHQHSERNRDDEGVEEEVVEAGKEEDDPGERGMEDDEEEENVDNNSVTMKHIKENHKRSKKKKKGKFSKQVPEDFKETADLTALIGSQSSISTSSQEHVEHMMQSDEEQLIGNSAKAANDSNLNEDSKLTNSRKRKGGMSLVNVFSGAKATRSTINGTR